MRFGGMAACSGHDKRAVGIMSAMLLEWAVSGLPIAQQLLAEGALYDVLLAREEKAGRGELGGAGTDSGPVGEGMEPIAGNLHVVLVDGGGRVAPVRLAIHHVRPRRFML